MSSHSDHQSNWSYRTALTLAAPISEEKFLEMPISVEILVEF